MSSSFKRRNRKPPPTSQLQNTSSTSSQAPPSITNNLLGTKPSTSGLPTTSFGLREIDSFFFSSSSSGGGGGQPLASCVLIEEDRLSNDLAWCLCRYWCGQGVSGGQVVLLGVTISLDGLLSTDGGCNDDRFDDGCTVEEMERFKLSLPRNLHLDKYRTKEKNQGSGVSDTSGEMMVREPIAIIEEDEGEESNEMDTSSSLHQTNEEGLVNAWQYRKSVQDARSGMSTSKISQNTPGTNVYCNSFDLSRSMCDQFTEMADTNNPLETHVKIIDCSNNINSHDYRVQGMQLFKTIWNHLQSTLSANNSQTVIRVFLQRLPIGPGSVALPLLMSKIRQENLPVVVLSTIRPWRYITSTNVTDNNICKLDILASLRNTADTIFAVDSFSSYRTPPPPEFSLLQGILTVRKCASTTTSYYTDTVCFKNRPLAERFGIKRDGRKVTVQLLHLPPEEYSKGGSSTDGVRSGGGQVKESSGGGCSSAKLTGASSSDW
eukprot:scaffold22130_cov62-Cyclotella_meneghiniana.AAC.10